MLNNWQQKYKLSSTIKQKFINQSNLFSRYLNKAPFETQLYVSPQDFGHLYAYSANVAYHLNTDGKIISQKQIDFENALGSINLYQCNSPTPYYLPITVSGQCYLNDTIKVYSATGLTVNTMFTLPYSDSERQHGKLFSQNDIAYISSGSTVFNVLSQQPEAKLHGNDFYQWADVVMQFQRFQFVSKVQNYELTKLTSTSYDAFNMCQAGLFIVGQTDTSLVIDLMSMEVKFVENIPQLDQREIKQLHVYYQYGQRLNDKALKQIFGKNNDFVARLINYENIFYSKQWSMKACPIRKIKQQHIKYLGLCSVLMNVKINTQAVVSSGQRQLKKIEDLIALFSKIIE